MPLLSGEESANDTIRELREELSRGTGAFILDLQPALGTSEEDLRNTYFDGWHPKAKVYEKMGEYAGPILLEWLKKCGAAE